MSSTKKAKTDGAMRLGQGPARTEEPARLTITHRNGQYVYWAEDEDEEFREILEIASDTVLPWIQVTRLNTPSRNEYVRKHLRKYAKVGATNVPPEIREKVVRDSVAHCTLQDWGHIALPSGEIVEYSPEAGVEAFKADPDFYEAVMGAAANEDYHREKGLKEEAEALGEA